MDLTLPRGLGFLTQANKYDLKSKKKEQRSIEGKTFEFTQEHEEKPRKRRFKTRLNHVKLKAHKHVKKHSNKILRLD